MRGQTIKKNIFVINRLCINSLLSSLDEIAAKVIIEDGEEYESVRSQLAMAVASVKQYCESVKLLREI